MRAMVNGKRRTGKSTLGYFLARERAKAIFIWDPNNNFRKFPAVSSREELIEFLDEYADENFSPFPQFAIHGQSKPKEQGFTVRWLPDPNNLQRDFDIFSNTVREKMSGTYAILIDESDEEIQNRQQMSRALAWWMRRAPDEQDAPETVHVIQMTHSPQDVYTRARNLIDHVYVFRTGGKPELEWFADYTQDETTAEQIRTLSAPTVEHPEAPRHVLHIFDGPGGEKQVEVIEDSKLWFVDIGSHRGKNPLTESREDETVSDEGTEVEEDA